MKEKTLNETKDDFKDMMNMKLNEVLCMIAYNMDEQGATKGDVGRLVFENKYYGFSITVVKKEV